jgi:tRNA (cmo5U34)-methyltransferase
MNDNKTAHSSSEYDANIEKSIPYYSSIHDEVISFVSIYSLSLSKWLDTGCGTGTFVEKARKIFTQTSFYVCDPSIEMLTMAKNKFKGEVVSLGAIDTPSLDHSWDGQFDIITAIQCFHYLDKQGRADSIGRCFELLKKNGLFFTFENTRPLTAEGEEVFKAYWKEFQIRAGKSPDQAEAHIRRYDVEYFPITTLEHINLLKSTGFSIVELFWYSYMQSGYLCIK